MVHLAVAVLGLADATVGERVAGVVWVHAKVQVVAGVRHGQLRRERWIEREKRWRREREREREERERDTEIETDRGRHREQEINIHG